MTTLRFPDLLLVETVRAAEERASLEDGAAVVRACASATTREQRILQRARSLGERLDLARDFAATRRLLGGLALGAALLVALLASSLAGSLLGSGRSLNVLLALLALVLPNALGLAAWLLLLTFGRGGTGLVTQGLLALARRIGSERQLRVLAAASRIFDRHGLGAWVWGGVNHAVWALVYAALFGAMWLAFAFREYSLHWETTILPQASFDRMLQWTAAFPAWLGLPAHDAAAIAAGGSARNAALAWWLMSGVLAYGLLPRVLALLACIAVWSARSRRLGLDLADPYYRRLLNRFDAVAPTRVVDEEQARRSAPEDAGPAWAGRPGTLAVVAFELPPELAAPQRLAEAADGLWSVDGSLAERSEAVRGLAERRPEALLLLCHATSTPDRGTSRFIEEARAAARRCAVLLLPAARAGEGAARWRDWLDASRLQQVGLFTDEAAALTWAEGRDG